MIVALATCEELAELYPSDQRLAAELVELGHQAVPWVWTREPPQEIDAVLIRTPWDYWHQANRFRRWIEGLSALGPVINPASTLLWNLDKRYLLELERAGIAIPPTSFVRAGASLAEVMDDLELDTAVIKPAISAGGDDTFVVARADAATAQSKLDGILARGTAIVQAFVSEIRDGELSLVFFDGQYSHAVRKCAADGEFRIHVEHGGRVEAATPSASLIAQASRAVAHLPEPPAYARVDGIDVNGTLVLMELELIEPELFFEFSEHSAARFAAVVSKRLADN